MTTLNRDSSRAARAAGVHALTDVTGFGLLGHLHELAAASGVAAEVEAGAVPAIDGVLELFADERAVSGGTRRNRAHAEGFATFADSIPEPRRWLVTDQRTVADRPDVLTYESDVLTAPLHVGGAPMVNLFTSTTGTDGDWVVKLIDVYPEELPSDPPLGGYQLPIAMDIFRGRYRESFSRPSAIPSGKVERYRFALPHVNHVFLPGHRLMVQIQSSWFPLYDRNPQTYVPNIFFARPGDYRKATQRVFHTAGAASFIELPVVGKR